MRILLLIFALTYFTYGQTRRDNPLAKGFPPDIDWVDWSRAVRVAKSRNKPIFFLIHKSWCGACKSLKKEFENDPDTPELIELSKKFVMVNVEDDDEPTEKEYKPDGAYIPRLLFLDTNGKHLQTNNVKRFRNHKFFYPLIPEIIDGMKRALVEFESVRRTKREESENDAVDGQDTEEQTDLEEETEDKEGKKEMEVSEEDEEERGEEKTEAETSQLKTEQKPEDDKKREKAYKEEKEKMAVRKEGKEKEEEEKKEELKKEKKEEKKKEEKDKKQDKKAEKRKEEKEREDTRKQKKTTKTDTGKEGKKDEL